MASLTKFFSNNGDVIITIKTVGDPPSHPPRTVRLNLADNLSIIRKNKLGDNTLLFSRKYSKNNDDDGFAEIAFEEEKNYYLNEIIDKDKKILYLKQCSKPDWEWLNKEHKLDYGCTMTFDGIKKADKRAFEMKNCELKEIGAEGYRKGLVEFRSSEDRMMKKNLFFSTDINVE